MSWTTLGNGKCPPPPPEGMRFVYSCSGTDNQIAIDNQGRIYTWGVVGYTYTGQTPVAIPATLNFTLNDSFEYHGASGYLMTFPYQVGNKSGWKKAHIYERQFVAQDADNYLWAWGDGYRGIGGWDITDQYELTSSGPEGLIYSPGGDTALVPQKINNLKWLDFSTGYTSILALGEDKRVYVWGENYYIFTFGSPTYPAHFKTLTPVLVDTLPDVDYKLIHMGADNSVAVTYDDKIYAWGRFSWGDWNTPQLMTLSIPIGVIITQAIATYGGIVILLSNGNVYCRGYRMQFAPEPNEYFDTLTLIPGNHNFTYVSAFEYTVGALDDIGNIWGWGIADRFISRDDSFCNQESYLPGSEPVFVASPTLGARQFTYFSVGNTSHCGIDTQGQLFCWGSDLWGQLGVGYLPEDHSCSPLEVVHPTLDNGVLAYEEQGATSLSGLVIRIPIPEQLAAHDPCGHWHKGGGDISRKLTEFAANCWEPTIATDGSHVLYVIAGRHRPNELYMLRYDIPTNKWTEVLSRKDVLHSNWDGGAATKSGIHVYHNYAYDITGEQYNESTSNPRTITYVTYSGGTNIKEWLGTQELHARNKVAVADGGKVACIIRVGSTWEVQVSTNLGSSWSLLQTLPTTITDASVDINPNDGLVYVAAVNQAADNLLLYVGNINGTGWTLRSTTVIMDASHKVYFRVDGIRLHATVESNVGTKFFYSTNNGTSFIAKDLHESITPFAATGTLLYNLADGPDWRTDDYEAASITWDQITQFETLIERCTLHNSGTTAVYCQAKLRVEGSEGNIVSILLSHNLGERWNEISTPLNYYETFEETLNLNDDPVWHFVPQYAKF